jgi:hypothetical protein
VRLGAGSLYIYSIQVVGESLFLNIAASWPPLRGDGELASWRDFGKPKFKIDGINL